MKKLIAVALLAMICTAFAAADTSNASLVLVKKPHHRVTKHHAHKAVKHRAPKHRHNTI